MMKLLAADQPVAAATQGERVPLPKTRQRELLLIDVRRCSLMFIDS
ncbi:MAG TPA: hypothetical protein VGD78_04630 [Chthoniobacterales bacterium]